MARAHATYARVRVPVGPPCKSRLSRLPELKAATSLKELAPILGLPAKALAYTLYKIPPAQKYTFFSIPKKSGGVRNISAPTPRLKNLQTYLADLLVECRTEIESRYPRRKLISHAFRSDGSIMTNAVEHRAIPQLDLAETASALGSRISLIFQSVIFFHRLVSTNVPTVEC